MFLVLFSLIWLSCQGNLIENSSDDNRPGGTFGEPWRLPIDSEPAWSPDGSTIAFYHEGVVYDTALKMETIDPDSQGIWFITPDGENKRMFLKGASLPAWGPNGDWLTFVYGSQIYKIKANGDSLTQLTFEGRNFFPSWSPNGKWIAYDNTSNCSAINRPEYSCGVLILKSDGSDRRYLIGGRMPDWSPDGQKIAFIGLGGEVYIVNVNDTSEVVQVTSFSQTYSHVRLRYPTYSPKGLRIAFHSGLRESYGVWVIDLTDYQLVRLTEGYGRYASWSPDGERIVTVGPDLTLWIMDTDGENGVQLTFRPQPPG